MKSFTYILLIAFFVGCGINLTEDDKAAEAESHKLVFAEIAGNRIINGKKIEITIEDSDGKLAEEGNFATLSVTLARKCDDDKSYQDVDTVDAVKGTATFTIKDWKRGKCSVRATASGASEAKEQDLTVGAKLLTIEMQDKLPNVLLVKRAFTLKVKATSSDGRTFAKDSTLYLYGPRHLRQFGKEKAEAKVDGAGVATFNNLYFIAPVATDIELSVWNQDENEVGYIDLTSEILLQQLTAEISSATFNSEKATMTLTGLSPSPSDNKIYYAVRNSDNAKKRNIICTDDKGVALAAGDSEITITKTTCFEEKLTKANNLSVLFVDVLIKIDEQTSEVRSTPLRIVNEK